MAGIEKYNSPAKVQRLGNDSVYGTGADGDATISGTLTLSRDMYYNNLTVPLGNIILTNGYKIFVKNTATINGVIGIGTVTGASNGVTNGTITSATSNVAQNTLSGATTSTITYRTGGQGGGNSNPNATLLPSWLFQNIETLISGVLVDQTYAATPIALSGGSKGTTGTQGTTAAKYTNSDSWTGKAGAAGSNGNYSPNASTVNSPGGKGNTGYAGTANGATDGTGGAGGAGGAGGGVVLICAKNISGSGKIMSIGYIGDLGANGSTGQPGTAGAAKTAYNSTTQRGTSGVDLNDGHQAPDIHHSHGGYHHHHCTHETSHHYGGCNPHYDHSWGAHDPGHHCCCLYGIASSSHCGYGHNLGYAHYTGGAGGDGGAAAPAVTGGAGKRGGGGGGGSIFIITETNPANLTYDVRAATTADSDTVTATSGSSYVILNN